MATESPSRKVEMVEEVVNGERRFVNKAVESPTDDPSRPAVSEDDPWQDRLAAAIVQAVAELPDRTSPDDWPDAMLVTADELSSIVRAAAEREIHALRQERDGARQEIDRLRSAQAAAQRLLRLWKEIVATAPHDEQGQKDARVLQRRADELSAVLTQGKDER